PAQPGRPDRDRHARRRRPRARAEGLPRRRRDRRDRDRRYRRLYQQGRPGVLMPRTHVDSLRWVEHGTQLLATQIAALDERAMAEPSALPGGTRKHLVAHIAANADALGNLAHWARTGERTPMYASMDRRNADIESGARRSATQLKAWMNASARNLA